jgi:hypothetical protein
MLRVAETFPVIAAGDVNCTTPVLGTHASTIISPGEFADSSRGIVFCTPWEGTMRSISAATELAAMALTKNTRDVSLLVI